MSYQATVFKVMIASPSDVNAERNTIREVITRWNNAHSESRRIVLMPVGWETHSTPEMGDRPQALLNKQILLDCDLLIGVFWTRLGTSTGEYASGTVEEIERHIAQEKPAMLYFSNAPVRLDSVDDTQYLALRKFKTSCQSRSLYTQYQDATDFANIFDQHLQITLNRNPYFHIEDVLSDHDDFVDLLPHVPKLREEAIAILRAAASNNGYIILIEALNGTYLQAGGQQMIQNTEAREVAKWKSALSELEEQGFVEHTGKRPAITS